MAILLGMLPGTLIRERCFDRAAGSGFVACNTW